MPATFTISATDQHGRKVEVSATAHENEHVNRAEDAASKAFKAAAEKVGLGTPLEPTAPKAAG